MPLKRNGIKYPRMTEILNEAESKPALPQWAANEAVAWIKENCSNGIHILIKTKETGIYFHEDYWRAYESDLDKARFGYKQVSEEALEVGSQVHDMIERYLNARIVSE